MQLELPVHQEGRLFEVLTWTIQRRQCAEATRAQHVDHRRWLVEHFGDVPLREVNYAAVMAYVDGERNRGIANITIRKRLVTLRMGLDDAYRRGLLPTKADWWPRLEGDSRPGQDLWTYDQYKQGRLAFDPQQRVGVDVLWWTGMHISDVLRWQRRDVDLTGRTWRRYNTKSKATPADLPLPDELRELLEEWFATEGILWGAHKVAPLMWQFPVKPLAKVCARAGLPRITPNGFRRSCVSYIFELGAKQGKAADAVAEFVALWLGHKGDPQTSSIIRTHYRRWTPEAIRIGSVF